MSWQRPNKRPTPITLGAQSPDKNIDNPPGSRDYGCIKRCSSYEGRRFHESLVFCSNVSHTWDVLLHYEAAGLIAWKNEVYLENTNTLRIFRKK